MSEWWTYTLSDFLPFSPRVYYRLLELHNQAVWPAQVLTLVLGLAVLVLLMRPIGGRDRIISAILGILWIWIAFAFFWQRYATINWASIYVAPLFALQGLLLLWVGTARRSLVVMQANNPRSFVGRVLFATALFVYPLMPLALGRPWRAAEIFGIAPDPTVLATLGVLILSVGRNRAFLFLIPLLWCAASGATLWGMNADEYFLLPAGALAALGIGASAALRSKALGKSRSSRRRRRTMPE